MLCEITYLSFQVKLAMLFTNSATSFPVSAMDNHMKDEEMSGDNSSDSDSSTEDNAQQEEIASLMKEVLLIVESAFTKQFIVLDWSSDFFSGRLVKFFFAVKSFFSHVYSFKDVTRLQHVLLRSQSRCTL